ncbi:hypothetical protein AAC03nite_19450 [Alicyclobacillus acidoterrestris]|nr:hypothetical protein AAC03nite_19450 [Alicyclobacillus acidoterrestris]
MTSVHEAPPEAAAQAQISALTWRYVNWWKKYTTTNEKREVPMRYTPCYNGELVERKSAVCPNLFWSSEFGRCAFSLTYCDKLPQSSAFIVDKRSTAVFI